MSALLCPKCRTPLEARAESLWCPAGPHEFPICAGIPDLRVFPDPYLAPEADREKGRRLAELGAGKPFAQWLDNYWSITGETPAHLAKRYVRHDLAGETRGESLLRALETEGRQSVGSGTRVLDLGCRSGGLLVAAARRGAVVTGVDIAFRWLVVAGARLKESDQQATLVCACAQALPFPDCSFDAVIAGNVLEHTPDPEGLMREARRVLRPGGSFLALTCNRYSLGPEPHVRVWGVGFLPRALMDSYVRAVRGVNYRDVRLLSFFDLRRMAARYFESWRIGPPDIGESEQAGLPGIEKRLFSLYQRVKNWPIARLPLLLFGPLLMLWGVRTEGQA